MVSAIGRLAQRSWALEPSRPGANRRNAGKSSPCLRRCCQRSLRKDTYARPKSGCRAKAQTLEWPAAYASVQKGREVSRTLSSHGVVYDVRVECSPISVETPEERRLGPVQPACSVLRSKQLPVNPTGPALSSVPGMIEFAGQTMSTEAAEPA